jgi:hypothetical protein
MKPQQKLKSFRLDSWFVAILISILVHLIFFEIEIKPSSKQQVKTIYVELIVQKKPTPKAINSKNTKPDVTFPLRSKKPKKPIASKQILKPIIASHLRTEEKTPLHDRVLILKQPGQIKNTDSKSYAKKQVKTDWNNVTKEFIREKYDKDILREKRHDELWFKSQSIMYGKPRNYFDKQDKRAMLIEPGESKRKSYFPKKKKNSDFGIKLGKHCFLGFKDMDKMKQGDPRLSGVPFSCDF